MTDLMLELLGPEHAVGAGERLEEEEVGGARQVLVEELRHAAQHPREPGLAPPTHAHAAAAEKPKGGSAI